MVELLFLAMPWVCLRFVIVVFSGHTHLLFLKWFNVTGENKYILSREMRFQTMFLCATSKASDQPAHTRSLVRAFASRLTIK